MAIVVEAGLVVLPLGRMGLEEESELGVRVLTLPYGRFEMAAVPGDILRELSDTIHLPYEILTRIIKSSNRIASNVKID